MAMPCFTAEASLYAGHNFYPESKDSSADASTITPQLRRRMSLACSMCKSLGGGTSWGGIGKQYCDACCGPGYYWDPGFDECMPRGGGGVINIPNSRDL